MAKYTGLGISKNIGEKEEKNILAEIIEKIQVKDGIIYTSKSSSSSSSKSSSSSSSKSSSSSSSVSSSSSSKGIDLYPLILEEITTTNLLTLDEALKSQLAEVIETGVISKLIIKNKSSLQKILVLEGTIVRGGKQNRVINTTLILDVNSSCDVPATCVEQHRWTYSMPVDYSSMPSVTSIGVSYKEFNSQFYETKYVMPTLYAKLNSTVNINLCNSQSYNADQQVIWGAISSLSGELNNKSSTADFTKIYVDRDKEIKECYEAFMSELKNLKFNGLLAIINKQIMFLNFSTDTEIMRVRVKPFIESVVAEMLRGETGKRNIEINDILNFINSLSNLPVKKYKKSSGDIDVRFSDSINGSYYLHNDELIFLTAMRS